MVRYKHDEAVEIPVELHFDRWIGQYIDDRNDVWVYRRHGRKTWIVSFRDRGNLGRIVSHHIKLPRALAAAAHIVRARRTDGAA